MNTNLPKKDSVPVESFAMFTDSSDDNSDDSCIETNLLNNDPSDFGSLLSSVNMDESDHRVNIDLMGRSDTINMDKMDIMDSTMQDDIKIDEAAMKTNDVTDNDDITTALIECHHNLNHDRDGIIDINNNDEPESESMIESDRPSNISINRLSTNDADATTSTGLGQNYGSSKSSKTFENLSGAFGQYNSTNITKTFDSIMRMSKHLGASSKASAAFDAAFIEFEFVVGKFLESGVGKNLNSGTENCIQDDSNNIQKDAQEDSTNTNQNLSSEIKTEIKQESTCGTSSLIKKQNFKDAFHHDGSISSTKRVRLLHELMTQAGKMAEVVDEYHLHRPRGELETVFGAWSGENRIEKLEFLIAQVRNEVEYCDSLSVVQDRYMNRGTSSEGFGIVKDIGSNASRKDEDLVYTDTTNNEKTTNILQNPNQKTSNTTSLLTTSRTSMFMGICLTPGATLFEDGRWGRLEANVKQFKEKLGKLKCLWGQDVFFVSQLSSRSSDGPVSEMHKNHDGTKSENNCTNCTDTLSAYGENGLGQHTIECITFDYSESCDMTCNTSSTFGSTTTSGIAKKWIRADSSTNNSNAATSVTAEHFVIGGTSSGSISGNMRESEMSFSGEFDTGSNLSDYDTNDNYIDKHCKSRKLQRFRIGSNYMKTNKADASNVTNSEKTRNFQQNSKNSNNRSGPLSKKNQTVWKKLIRLSAGLTVLGLVILVLVLIFPHVCMDFQKMFVAEIEEVKEDGEDGNNLENVSEEESSLVATEEENLFSEMFDESGLNGALEESDGGEKKSENEKNQFGVTGHHVGSSEEKEQLESPDSFQCTKCCCFLSGAGITVAAWVTEELLYATMSRKGEEFDRCEVEKQSIDIVGAVNGMPKEDVPAVIKSPEATEEVTLDEKDTNTSDCDTASTISELSARIEELEQELEQANSELKKNTTPDLSNKTNIISQPDSRSQTVCTRCDEYLKQKISHWMLWTGILGFAATEMMHYHLQCPTEILEQPQIASILSRLSRLSTIMTHEDLTLRVPQWLVHPCETYITSCCVAVFAGSFCGGIQKCWQKFNLRSRISCRLPQCMYGFTKFNMLCAAVPCGFGKRCGGCRCAGYYDRLCFCSSPAKMILVVCVAGLVGGFGQDLWQHGNDWLQKQESSQFARSYRENLETEVAVLLHDDRKCLQQHIDWLEQESTQGSDTSIPSASSKGQVAGLNLIELSGVPNEKFELSQLQEMQRREASDQEDLNQLKQMSISQLKQKLHTVERAESNDQQSLVRDLRGEEQKQEARVEVLNRETAAEEKGYHNLKDAHEIEVTAAQSEEQKLGQSLAAEKTKVAVARSEEQKLRQSVAGEKEKVAAAQSEEQKLRQSVAGEKEKVAAAQSEEQKLKQSVAGEKEKVAAAGSEEQNLKQSLATEKTKYDDLKSANDSKEQKLRHGLAEEKKKVAAAGSEEQNLKQSLAAEKTKYDDLKSANDSKEQKLRHGLAEEKKKNDDLVTAAQSQKRESDAKIAKEKENYNDQQSLVRDLRSEERKQKAKIETLNRETAAEEKRYHNREKSWKKKFNAESEQYDNLKKEDKKPVVAPNKENGLNKNLASDLRFYTGAAVLLAGGAAVVRGIWNFFRPKTGMETDTPLKGSKIEVSMNNESVLEETTTHSTSEPDAMVNLLKEQLEELRQQGRAKDKTVSELEEKLESAQADADELRKQHGTLKTQADGARIEAEAAEARVVCLSAQLQDLQEKLVEAGEQQSRIAELEEKNQKLTESAATMEKVNTTLRDNCVQATARGKKLGQDEAMLDYNRGFEASQQKLGLQIVRADQELQKCQQQVTELQDQKDKAEEDLEAVKAQAAAKYTKQAKKEAAKAERENVELKRKLDEATNELQQVHSQITELKYTTHEEVETLKLRCEQEKAEKASYKRKIRTEIETKVQGQISEIPKLKEEIKNLNAQKAQQSQENQQLADAYNSLQKNLKTEVNKAVEMKMKQVMAEKKELGEQNEVLTRVNGILVNSSQGKSLRDLHRQASSQALLLRRAEKANNVENERAKSGLSNNGSAATLNDSESRKSLEDQSTQCGSSSTIPSASSSAVAPAGAPYDVCERGFSADPQIENAAWMQQQLDMAVTQNQALTRSIDAMSEEIKQLKAANLAKDNQNQALRTENQAFRTANQELGYENRGLRTTVGRVQVKEAAAAKAQAQAAAGQSWSLNTLATSAPPSRNQVKNQHHTDDNHK